MTKNEKITEALEKWRQSKGRAILTAPTRFGKSFLAIKAIEHFLSKNPKSPVIIGVPSKPLQLQWYHFINDRGLYGQVRVLTYDFILNKVDKVPLLILDEVHCSFSKEYINIYTKVKFKFFIGLTATLYRLDGREKLITKHIPVIEICNREEAVKNNWIETYKEYKVILDVEDYDTYIQHDQKFQKYFSFFNFDFDTAMACVKSRNSREAMANFKRCKLEIVNACSFGFNRELHARINFVQSHPKKITLVNKILESRKHRKIIIFSPTIELSKKFGNLHYNSDMPPSKQKKVLNTFYNLSEGVLSTVDSLSMGVDLNGCNTGIILSHNSSNIEKEQKIGRLLSKREDNLIPEVFTFVLKKTFIKSFGWRRYC